MNDDFITNDGTVIANVPFHHFGYTFVGRTKDNSIVMEKTGVLSVWTPVTPQTKLVDLWGCPVMFYENAPYKPKTVDHR